LDENGMSAPLTASDEGGCGQSPGGIQYPAIQFKTFHTVPGSVPTISMYLDEYDPRGSGPYPALILVHGGGWAIGCRWSVNADAIAFARDSTDPIVTLAQNFIVFAIDYREACDPNDPNVPSAFTYLCGWNYLRKDVDTGRQAAVQDVLDAVSWVRLTYPGLPNRPAWNGRVAVVGGSSGGNISTIASAVGSGNTRPDAVAGFSSAWEFSALQSPYSGYGCDAPYSGDSERCWIGHAAGGYSEGGVNRYLGCALNVEVPTA
jgi:acetyl esterase/lipase